MIDEKSIAHKHGMNAYGEQEYPDGLVPWQDAYPPDIAAGRVTGRLRSCWYCGSMHPADVATAIRAGAVGHWADRKYGWPHKAYFDGIPNPYGGMLESRTGCSNPLQDEIDAGKWIRVPTGRCDPMTGAPEHTWTSRGEAADGTTHGKFYSVHLQDASPDDRATIEAHLGLAFEFTDNGRVKWRAA